MSHNFAMLGTGCFLLCLGLPAPEAPWSSWSPLERLWEGRQERSGWGLAAELQGGGTWGARPYSPPDSREWSTRRPEGFDASWVRGSHRTLQFGLGGYRADTKQGIVFSPIAGERWPILLGRREGGSCGHRESELLGPSTHPSPWLRPGEEGEGGLFSALESGARQDGFLSWYAGTSMLVL